ncbi:MAG TPA: thrombospondin type 3 repeat-containing protein [Phycisphaerae bacterium]|nr:thrombospondin type 3 repeat-containing protein [Phycisphaerae bacterium]
MPGRSVPALSVVLAALLLGPVIARAAFLDPNNPNVLTFTAAEDDGFSHAVEEETLVNRGKSGSVRCKSSQEMVIMKFDLSSLAGWTISEAELHVGASSASLLYAADVCTINVPWQEGETSGGFNNGSPGDPCWDWRHIPEDMDNPEPDDWWTYPGSDFTSGTYGNNGSLASYAHPRDEGFTTYTRQTPGGDTTFYRIKLDPDVVHALIIGDQYGLTLSDTRGYRLQNNTVYLRDQWGGAAGPWLYLKGGATDTTPPENISNFVATPGEWNGQAMLSWTAPSNFSSTGRAFGYDVRISASPIDEANFASATQVDRWRIPRPMTPGRTQKMLLDGLDPGGTYYFGIRAYDNAGNNCAVAATSLTLPAPQSVTSFADAGFTQPYEAAAVAEIPGVLRYWACGDLSKVNPVTGDRIPGPAGDAYKKANAVWAGSLNRVSLRAAANEVVAFQLILEKLVDGLSNVTVSVSNLIGPGGATIAASPNIELFRCWYVRSGGQYYADACIPLFSPFPAEFRIPNPTNNVLGQTNQSVWADIYVPKGARAGTYTGQITVNCDQLASPLTVSLELFVRTFELPDEQNFILDLNGYHEPWDWAGTGNWPRYLDISLRYHQLGHKHRANVNTVPYSHQLDLDKSPRVDSTRTPALKGAGESIHIDPSGWTQFESQYARYLDGSAFTAAMGYHGPGENTPIPEFYLPVFESWPLSSYFWFDEIPGGLGGAYWYTLWPWGRDPNTNDERPPIEFLETAPAPNSYPVDYEMGVRNVVADFAERAQAMGWTDTYFQIYLNNKYTFGNLTGPHSQFWNLDEPSEGECMFALGYYYKIFRKGAADAAATAPAAKFHFRVDISDKTGMNRGKLDGLLNLWCCSNVNDYHGEIPIRQLKYPDEVWWYYGGGKDPSGSNLTNSKRFLQVWAWGIDGALPYWDNYSTNWWWAESLSIVYSGRDVPGYGTYDGAIASVRLKAMRRGQQDVEYLTYLGDHRVDWNRASVTRALRQRYANTSDPDSYTGMGVLDFHRLREDVALTIVHGDSDGDGRPDNVDNCPFHPNASQGDQDGDGVGDLCDQCPGSDDNSDMDNDGVPDGCDDSDNDGVLDDEDAFPNDPTEWSDCDGDGDGDNEDLDDDNDGYPDVIDPFPCDPDEWMDTDGDGIGNNADPDDDNDGVPDVNDPAPLNPLVPGGDRARPVPQEEPPCCGSVPPPLLAVMIGAFWLVKRRRNGWL